MIHVAHPVGPRHRPPLVVRNRNKRRATVGRIDRLQLREIEATVQRRNRLVDEAVQEGIVQHVDMEMQHVELGRERPHLFEHYDMMRDRILDAWVKP